MAEKLYLDTTMLNQYLKYLEQMKSKMIATINQGKKTAANAINFDDDVIKSACEHVDSISENIKKMTEEMDHLAEVAKKLYIAYAEVYNKRI